MIEKIKLAIIEDNEDLLKILSEYFNQINEFQLSLASLSMEEFFKASLPEKIDVILLDLMLPGVGGIDGIPLLKEKYPEANILVISVLDDSVSVFTALKRGACGYITKETPLENIKNAIINAYNGMSVMNQDIAGKVLDFFNNNHVIEKLSKKELIIAEGLKIGKSYKMIAFDNNVSIDAVRFHVRNIYKKLQINSKGELINLMMSRKGNH
jgi:DNA-binding NarL/FixJ family response regulator